MTLSGAPSLGDSESYAPSGESGVTRPDPARELLCLCHDMWFLLSGVSNRQYADAAAPEFRRLLEATIALSERVYSEENLSAAGAEETHASLDESLDELTAEFSSLCAARCFGSEKLIAEFRYSIEVGLFEDDCAGMLQEPVPHLNEAETRNELQRMKKLLDPDREVLAALTSVQDARSAQLAGVRLLNVSELFRSLKPESVVATREFAPKADSSARRAYQPLEPVLWEIRSEIVRIASLPGYHKKEFDSFSLALETVFRSLAETHHHFFDEVFDDSFHADLDEALRENATTSN